MEFGDQPTDEQLNLVTCYNLLTLALVDNLEASLFKRTAYGDLSMEGQVLIGSRCEAGRLSRSLVQRSQVRTL